MRRLALSSSVLVAVVCLAVTAHAQQALKQPPGKWWKDRRLIDDLKLSPEQQSRIDHVWMEGRKSLIDKKAEFDKRSIDLADVLSRPETDESAAIKAFDMVQAARVDLERSMFLMRLRIKMLLSREQQQRLEEIADQFRRDNRAIRANGPAAAPARGGRISKAPPIPPQRKL